MIEHFSQIKSERTPGPAFSYQDSEVRYGQQITLASQVLIAKIIGTDDDKERNSLVDKLVSQLEKNSEKNSFFIREEVINETIGGLGSQLGGKFKLDDAEPYHIFFKYLHDYTKMYPDKSRAAIVKKSAIKTNDDYFGLFNGDYNKNKELVRWTMDQDGNEIVPSIRGFKNQKCALCIERATLAHNLFLLAGYESGCVRSGDIRLAGSGDAAHAYCIVRLEKNQTLFDPSMRFDYNFEEDRNVVDEILDGKPIVVEKYGIESVYANNSALEKEQKLEIT